MIKLILILLAISSWASIFIYFWRTEIFAWLDNRFGKTPLPPHPMEEPDEPVDYDAPLFAEKSQQPEQSEHDGSDAPSPGHQ